MKIKLLVIYFLTAFSVIGSAQELIDKISYISFELQHTRRAPNNHVLIEIEKKQNETIVKSSSIPSDDSKKWAKTKVDTSFSFDSKVFVELLDNVLLIENINLNNAFLEGADGTYCSIEFGTFGNSIKYKFWSPTCMTEYRGLNDFLNLCKRIIIIGGLIPEEIL